MRAARRAWAGLLAAALCALTPTPGPLHPPAGAAAPAQDRRPAAARPNVVVILLDDVGAHDMGYAGSSFYRTPNIDRLARESTVFSAAYASATVCSPSRAALQTGRHPARFGIDYVPGYTPPNPTALVQRATEVTLPRETTTVAELFRRAGYATGFVGKWHLGEAPGDWPEAHGYDVNVGGWSGGAPRGGYFSPYRNPRLPDGPPGEFLEERLARESARFIERNAGRPFLLVHSFYAAHRPFSVAPAHGSYYLAARRKLGPAPEPLPERFGRLAKARQDHVAFASLVSAADDAVGVIRAALRRAGVADNTVILFTSDNGGAATNLRPDHPIADVATSNLPLRAGKGWLYEGGIRAPMLLHVPGGRGLAREAGFPVTTADILPTLAALAGVRTSGLPLDGRDVTPWLRADAGAPERSLFWHFPAYHDAGARPAGAVRRGRYKLVEWFEDGAVELYDLASDPGERTNIAADRPGIARRLRKELRDWRRRTGANMPAKSRTRAG